MRKKTNKKSAYTISGVNIDAGEKAVDLIKQQVQTTYNQYTLSKVGAFGGLFDASIVKSLKNPVLVQSIDGVGTKLMVAEMMKIYTIGQDIVNHCANDILTLGAKPLTFLNYVGTARLVPKIMEKIVGQMVVACKEVGIPIIGGETAEMPDVYQKGRHDVVGCITGVVEKTKIIDGKNIVAGDVLIGLPSNGLHTNGYSLARKAFFETAGYNVDTYLDELGCTVGEELLKIHKCYFQQIYPLLEISTTDIHGIAHITGGGLIDNIARLLPQGLCAKISGKWEIPPVFHLIQEIEKVSDEEMRRVFNLGIGMVAIVSPNIFKSISEIPESIRKPALDLRLLGEIKKTRSKKRKRVFFS